MNINPEVFQLIFPLGAGAMFWLAGVFILLIGVGFFRALMRFYD